MSLRKVTLLKFGIRLPSVMDFSQGGEVWKILSVGHSLKVISRIQEKTVARKFCSFSSEALQSL